MVCIKVQFGKRRKRKTKLVKSAYQPSYQLFLNCVVEISNGKKRNVLNLHRNKIFLLRTSEMKSHWYFVTKNMISFHTLPALLFLKIFLETFFSNQAKSNLAGNPMSYFLFIKIPHWAHWPSCEIQFNASGSGFYTVHIWKAKMVDFQ